MSDVKKDRFTPGPWFYENGFVFSGCDKIGDAVASIGNSMFRKKDEDVANMRLIAQAPEMYALLAEIDGLPIEGLSGSMKDAVDWVNFKGRVNNVLKKARGEV